MISTNIAEVCHVFDAGNEHEGQKDVEGLDCTVTNNIDGSQALLDNAFQAFGVEDSFEGKRDLDVEHTPEKEIIQSGMKILDNIDNFQSASSSKILNFGTQILVHNSKKVLNGNEKHTISRKATSDGKNGCLYETNILDSDFMSQTKTDSSLVQMVWRKIESIASREREVEQVLNKERIESLVSKVEEEVEFEGMIEHMRLRFRAAEEYIDMERLEKDWERERREVRLEEEVKFLRNKVEFLQEKIIAAYANKGIEFQTTVRPLEVDDTVVDKQLPLHFESGSENKIAFQTTGDATHIDFIEHEEPNAGIESVLTALREMLSLADQKQEQDRRNVDTIMQAEWETIINNQRQLENKILFLEMELNNRKNMLKEKESTLILEKERRRKYGIEAGRILAFWREENLAYNALCQRLRKIQDFLPEFSQKAVSSMKTLEEKNSFGELLRCLDNVVNEKADVSIISNDEQNFLWQLVDSWKSKNDHLEEEIDKLKEQLGESKSKTKETLKKLEILQKEKGILNIPDAESCSRDRNLTEASITNLRQRESETVNSAYDEKARFEGCENVHDREITKDEQYNHYWIILANKKEEELVFLRSIYQKIEKLLTKSKKKLQDLKGHLVRQNKGLLKVHNCNFGHTGKKSSDGAGSDLESRYYTDSLESSEISEDDDHHYVVVQWLVKDISEEIERLSEELLLQEASLERAQTDISIGTEQLKEERRELERKVADALVHMDELRQQIKEKEGQMEQDRKQMDTILASRIDMEENLKQQLHVKENEIEMNAQKFRDQMDVLKEELVKEQKEKEEFIKMHFATSDQLIIEMKENDTKWEREIESMSQEMQELRVDIDLKNKQILRFEDELKKYKQDSVYLKQMEHDGKVSFRDGHEIEFISSSQEHNLTEESVVYKFSLGSMPNTIPVNIVRPAVDWQNIIGKVAGFDKQIADAMLGIESLKEEFNVKEKELQKATLGRDAERNTEWMEERTQLLDIVDISRANDNLQDNQNLIQLLEAERADTADAMSILEGAVLELQWALNYYKGKDIDSSNIESGKEFHCLSTSKDPHVKVHASHLEDLEKLIIDLKLKAEQAESRAINAEVALAVNALKETAKCTRISSTLVKFGNDWFDNEVLTKNCMKCNAKALDFSSSFTKVSQIEGNSNEKTGKIARNLQREPQWSGESPEHYQLWDMNASSVATDVTSNNSSNSWMMVRGCMDDDFAIQDASQQGPLALTVSTPRHQRKWLVDGLWLDNVRKEYALLQHQLEFERQHVSDLKQVEAENRWMEATIVHSLEQKKDSDRRVLELERKVAFLEAMIAQNGSQERSPFPSTAYATNMAS